MFLVDQPLVGSPLRSFLIFTSLTGKATIMTANVIK